MKVYDGRFKDIFEEVYRRISRRISKPSA